MQQNLFESIKHIDEDGNEYWLARELKNVLEYKRWDKFYNVILSAIDSCHNSHNYVYDHFSQVGKMIVLAKGAERKIIDYKLSRYACYLIAQNADPRKEVVALAQTYFAIQTWRQELQEKDYESLTEEEKRFYQRNLTKKGNYSLNQTAKAAGDIAKRKGLRYREDIIDNMGSVELAANLFRITQTEEKLKNDDINHENMANKTHYEVGKKVRKVIKELGGTMPENLPKPNKSLKEIEKSNKRQLL